MKQVIVLKLEATPEQHQALLETVEAFNRGCDFVAEVAFAKRLANKIALQPFVYGTLRAEFGLSSQMAVRCISKAVEAYKEIIGLSQIRCRQVSGSAVAGADTLKASPS